MLIDELVAKLPDSAKMKWAESIDNLESDPSLEDFRWFIERQTQIMSNIVTYVKASESKFQKDSKGKDQQRTTKKVTETLLNVEENLNTAGKSESTKSPRKRICTYCECEGHWGFKCPVFEQDPINTKWSVIKQKKLCCGCLRPGHSVKECKTKRKCTNEGCKFNHHPYLHCDTRTTENFESSSPAKSLEKEQVSNILTGKEKPRVLLRIAPVLIKGPKTESVVYALFDEASTCTLVDQSLADKFGLRGMLDPLHMRFARGLEADDDSSERIKFSIADPKTKEF
ncbi:unnamed protein product, partial [Allacma fusca]